MEFTLFYLKLWGNNILTVEMKKRQLKNRLFC